MKLSFLEILVCPQCGGQLDPIVLSGQEKLICEGKLNCLCGKVYPVQGGVPRFVPTDDYVRSFSFQWRKHWKTQLDSSFLKES